MTTMPDTRDAIRARLHADEAATVRDLIGRADLSETDRRAISARATELVRAVRAKGAPTMMEAFLGQYGLSTREGIALMCLAEALLRVPDAETIDDLIADKIAPGDWSRHLGASSSTLVNASTWALLLTGRVVEEGDDGGLPGILHGLVRRLGEPVIRTAVSQAMRELGDQFVLGRTIGEALDRAEKLERDGYTYSYDMLGEAARTHADATRYFAAYADAIHALGPKATSTEIAANPGISIKLSALDPRYDYANRKRVLDELTPRVVELAMMAKTAGIGFNVDAEEADRLDLSLDVIEAVLADTALAGWDGFGVVVQAYGQRALPVLDHVHALAERHDRRLMVRLVKGAYWDTEIKQAQTLGLDGFPVFTRKANTDLCYIACARHLLRMSGRLYPQFATHNAHTTAAILHMAETLSVAPTAFEFQRLHGMGETLHDIVKRQAGTRCRIYAPVGAHSDLLAYLVRRLLENGANSSFVNQIVDDGVAPEDVARDPLDQIAGFGDLIANPAIARPAAIFGPDRANARGWDLTDPVTVAELKAARDGFAGTQWTAAPTAQDDGGANEATATERWTVINPAEPSDIVGHVTPARPADVDQAVARAERAFPDWSARPVADRARLVEGIADLYEAHAAELMALATREAGKTWLDGVAELREAVDFCRYYANEARRQAAEGHAGAEAGDHVRGRGPFACISPWNFPLAIFTGQVTAALAAGNTVLAKPAEQTCLMAARAVALMHEAGVPDDVVQLLPGDGPSVGAVLTSDPRIAGVCFTGSTETAQTIHRAMADHLAPDAPLIAETGGLNAMIVDSTALPEQAVRDILASAFQSAGQRCSALRLLYVQEEVEDRLTEMLTGAMDCLAVGDPGHLSTDVGPVIDDGARAEIAAYCAGLEARGQLIHKLEAPETGHFVAPALFKVQSIAALDREIFGPVLHLATFKAEHLDQTVDAINARGYGLTLGMHSRVDRRIEQVVSRAHVGNIYINRNQIGAVVGSQPFGGEGLSGTGPKAGGPHYLARFLAEPTAQRTAEAGASQGLSGEPASAKALGNVIETVRGVLAGFGPNDRPRDHIPAFLKRLPEAEATRLSDALDGWPGIGLTTADLPGPTGESNRLGLHPRGVFLCLGRLAPDGLAEDGVVTAIAQALRAAALGNAAVIAAPSAGDMAADFRAAGLPVACLDKTVPAALVSGVEDIAGICAAGPPEALRPLRRALAMRGGPILPLVVGGMTGGGTPERFLHERVVSIDTTAAGGNASLLASAG